MSAERKLIPIYTTRGDVGAFLSFPYIFSITGDWIGWVTPDQNVYSVYGQWIGLMTRDLRIIRNRDGRLQEQRRVPPLPPEPIRVPVNLPLAPQMGEIATQMMDVLDEAPELLPAMDTGEMHEDIA